MENLRSKKMKVKLLFLYLIISVNLFALEQVPYMSSYDNNSGHACRLIIPAQKFSINELDSHATVYVGVSKFIYKGKTMPTTDFFELWIDFSDNPDDFTKVLDSEFRMEYSTGWDMPFTYQRSVISEYHEVEIDNINKTIYLFTLGGVLPSTSSIINSLSNNQPFLLKLVGKDNKTVLLISISFSSFLEQSAFEALSKDFESEYQRYSIQLIR